MAKLSDTEINGNLNVRGSLNAHTFTLTSSSKTINSISGVLLSGTHVCIESWHSSDGKSGYRLYNDGYLEQWGFVYPKTTATVTVTLFYSYYNTNYNVLTTSSWTGNHVEDVNNSNKTVSSFQLVQGTGSEFGVYWRTLGFIRL